MHIVIFVAAHVAFSLRNRETLEYCPPVSFSLDASRKLLCGVENVNDGLAYLERRAEEIEWAAASLREIGLLSKEAFGRVIRVAEAGFLWLCSYRYQCAFNQMDINLEVAHRTHELARYVRELAGDRPWDWGFDGSGLREDEMLEAVHSTLYKLRGLNRNHVFTGPAWLPIEVVEGCSAIDLKFPGPNLPVANKDWRVIHHPLLRAEWILDALAAYGHKLNRLALNLGSHSGACSENGIVLDHANCAFEHGFGGIAIEGRAEFHVDLKLRHWKDVDIHVGYVTPYNLTNVLVNAHEEFDLVKVDLDHADCVFVEQLLTILPHQPKLLHVEYNSIFPPPIRYRERFSIQTVENHAATSDSWNAFRHNLQWMGCSLQAWVDALAERDYMLLQVELTDLLFVRKDLFPHVAHFVVAAEDLLMQWRAVWCRAPGRLMNGRQAGSTLDLRVLAEADDPCQVAERWWHVEGADAVGDLDCATSLEN